MQHHSAPARRTYGIRHDFFVKHSGLLPGLKSISTIVVTASLCGVAHAAIIIPTVADSSGANAFTFGPVSNTVDGSGLSGTLGNGDTLAYAQSLTHIYDQDASQSFVTNQVFPDYFASGGSPPVIVYDLGVDTELAHVIFWQYQNQSLGNHVRTIDLRFNTESQGSQSFSGTVSSVLMLPVEDNDADPDNDLGGINSAQTFQLSVTARYVQVTLTDNYLGFQGITNGGDRVGFGEIAFHAVPEPSAAILGAFGVLAMLRRCRAA